MNFRHVPFDAFAEAEPDSDPEVVYKAYDPVACEAVIQLSTGCTVKADAYEEGPRGFVIARWAKLDEVLETDAANKRLCENTIQKAVLVPATKLLPKKRTMKKPAAAPAPPDSGEGALISPAKKPAAAPEPSDSVEGATPSPAKKPAAAKKPSKTTDKSHGAPKESQGSPELTPEFAKKWQKTLDSLPLELRPQSTPKGSKNYTVKMSGGYYSIQVHLQHEALYLKPVKFTQVTIVELGLDSDKFSAFGFKDKYTRDKHGGVYVRWGTSPQLAYDIVQLMALHDSGESQEGGESRDKDHEKAMTVEKAGTVETAEDMSEKDSESEGSHEGEEEDL